MTTTNPTPNTLHDLTLSIDNDGRSHLHRRGCHAARRGAVDMIDVELTDDVIAALKAEAAELNSDTRFHTCMNGGPR